MAKVYRKEIKFIISKEQFQQIRKQLALYLKKDSHGIGGEYRVRSLYFDALHGADLFDSLSGQQSKSKIRMRIYTHDAKWVKLEYKRKFGLDGIKHGLTLTRVEANYMIDGDYRFLAARKEPLAAELYVHMVTGCYRPQSVVQYNREAYTHPVSNTRMTFDTSVSATETTGDFLKEHLCMIPLMPVELGVFEVKYDHLLIKPFNQIISRLNVIPNSNSKYVQSKIGF